jgi:hypothetical protein
MIQMTDRMSRPSDGVDLRWRWDGFLPRSYLFSIEPIARKPAHLLEVSLPCGQLFASPDYTCCVQRSGSSFIAMIGYCIDLENPGSNEADIVSSLLHRALRDGVDAMLAHTDDLFGRFAAICHIGGDWRVFADACATRTIYFAEDQPAIASHSTILGELVGAAPRMEIFQHYWCALPGNASPCAGVRVLPANFTLDPATRKLRRFWPRSPRRQRSVCDVIDEADAILGRTATATASRWKPAISLTAGLDSRLSLSVFYGAHDLVAFTYHRDAQDTADVEIAHRLCQRLGIPHRQLPLVARSQAESVYRLIEAIPDCTFDKHVAPIYLSAFPECNNAVIHVRSSLAEIGRAFWRYHPGMPTTLDPSNWIHVSLAKSTANMPKRAEAAAYLREEMQRFFTTVGYDSVDQRSPEIMGYDVWDLAYMEHRMSTWHAQALSGSDMAFDTSILFNSRRLLELIMSVPLQDRRRATLFRQIIARRCPQIADIPVNPRPRRAFGQLAAAAYRHLKRRVGFVRAIETRFKH